MDEIFLNGIVVFSINAVDFIISFSKTSSQNNKMLKLSNMDLEIIV